MISCEAYWVIVLRGGYANGDLRPEEEARWQEGLYPDIETLEALRAEVVASTESYLRETSAEVLSTPAEFYTFDQKPHILVPQWVIMRTLTHHFHHRGLAAAMCRMLGKPYPDDAPSMDFPLRPELPTS